MTPRPPALVTAAASFGPAATFIPARRTGWLIFKRSVVTVRSFSAKKSENLLYRQAIGHVIAPQRRRWRGRNVRGEDIVFGGARWAVEEMVGWSSQGSVDDSVDYKTGVE